MKSPEQTKMVQPEAKPEVGAELKVEANKVDPMKLIELLTERVEGLAKQNELLMRQIGISAGPEGSAGQMPGGGLMGLDEMIARSGMSYKPKSGKKVKIRLIRGAWINGKIVEPVAGKPNIHEVDEETAQELCDKGYKGPYAFRGARFEDNAQAVQKRAERVA